MVVVVAFPRLEKLTENGVNRKGNESKSKTGLADCQHAAGRLVSSTAVEQFCFGLLLPAFLPL